MTTLNSPGVDVEESVSAGGVTPTPTNLPLIILATRANKLSPDGSSTAAGTTESNVLRLVQSQRDVVQNYGNPVFVEADGVPVNGDETGEYGLLALWSFMGTASSAYVLRSNIDLGQLVPNSVQPSLPAPNGTYWINSANVTGGIFKYTSGMWTAVPFDIYTTAPTTANGNNGDWCFDYSTTNGTLKFKNTSSMWYAATTSNVTSYLSGASLAISATSPGTATTSGSTASGTMSVVVASALGLGVGYIFASGTTYITVGTTITAINYTTNTITLSANTSGIIPTTTALVFTPSANSFWFKTTTTSGGENLNLTQYNSTTSTWVSVPVVNTLGTPSSSIGVVSEVDSAIPTTGYRPLYVGTGSGYQLLEVFVQSQAPTSEPAIGTLWYNDLITDFAMAYNPTEQWVPITTTTNTNPTSTQKVISATPPLYPSTGAIWVDISTQLNIDNYPVCKQWNGTVWQLMATIPSSAINGVSSGDPYVPYTGSAPGVVITDQPLDPTLSTASIYWINTGDPITQNIVKKMNSPTNITEGLTLATTAVGGSATTSGSTASGSVSITVVSAANLAVGMLSSGNSGIPNGTSITSIVSNVIELSAATTAIINSSVALTFGTNTLVVTSVAGIGVGFTSTGNTSITNGTSITAINYATNTITLSIPIINQILAGAIVNFFSSSYTAYSVNSSTGLATAVPGWYWQPDTGSTFGRLSQRAEVVKALQATISSNELIRSEYIYYQLVSAPGYPELYTDMVNLSSDNGYINFVVADTPKFAIPSGIPTGREILATSWISNMNNVPSTSEMGFSGTGSPYSAFWYPWCQTTNVNGTQVFAPPSHMALSVIAYSDSVSAPWYPPAGYTRGTVTNASSVGYLDDNLVYNPLSLSRPQRDSLYSNNINPIANIPVQGLVVYGQKTMDPNSDPLNHINVARLIAKMKYDIKLLLAPFLFQLNDPLTWASATVVAQNYLAGLMTLQAVYDTAVVCDGTNNVEGTNTMYMEIGVSPSAGIDFIYATIDVLGPGESF